MISRYPGATGGTPSKVAVTIISGFLGSGKTTLLRRLVADPELGPRIAVVVNDVGELGLDPELVRSAGSSPMLRVTELVSGCVCCTLQGELNAALGALARGEGLPRRPEHIFIEPSGIARASELSFAVNALGFEQPLQVDAVVTLVDAGNARRASTEQTELFEDQLRSADLVILNKRDLLPDPAAQTELEGWLHTLAPRATFIWSERAAVDLALLIGRLDLFPNSAAQQPHHHHPEGGEGHGHGHGHGAHDIGAVTLPMPLPVERAALEDWLEQLGERIFRIKGIVDAHWEGAAAPQPTLVQAVGDRVELDIIAATSAMAGSPRRLIFIGAPAALNEQELNAAVAALSEDYRAGRAGAGGDEIGGIG